MPASESGAIINLIALISSPSLSLGFWAVRGQVPLQCEIRVYPNCSPTKKPGGPLSASRLVWPPLQARLERARVFEQLREYVPGDGFDEVHESHCQTRSPHHQDLQVERTQESMSLLMRHGCRRGLLPPVRRAAVDPLVRIRCRSCHRARTLHHRRFGPGTRRHNRAICSACSPSPTKSITSSGPKWQGPYNNCRDALYTLEPRIVTPDYDELCTFCGCACARRALAVFLTSLDDSLLAESFVRNIELIRVSHLVLVNMLQPPGANPSFHQSNITTLDEPLPPPGRPFALAKVAGTGEGPPAAWRAFLPFANERLSARNWSRNT